MSGVSWIQTNEPLSGYRTDSASSRFKWQRIDLDRPFKVFPNKPRSNKRLAEKPSQWFDCTNERCLLRFLTLYPLFFLLTPTTYIHLHRTGHCSSACSLDFHAWSTCSLLLNVLRVERIDQTSSRADSIADTFLKIYKRIVNSVWMPWFLLYIFQ